LQPTRQPLPFGGTRVLFKFGLQRRHPFGDRRFDPL
jgi:hypothetical protein